MCETIERSALVCREARVRQRVGGTHHELGAGALGAAHILDDARREERPRAARGLRCVDRREAHRDPPAHRVADEHDGTVDARGAARGNDVARKRIGTEVCRITQFRFTLPAQVQGERRIAAAGEFS